MRAVDAILGSALDAVRALIRDADNDYDRVTHVHADELETVVDALTWAGDEIEQLRADLDEARICNRDLERENDALHRRLEYLESNLFPEGDAA